VSATTRYDHTAVLTLALDTSTRAGSVAIVRDDHVLAVVEGDATRTHGERLPSEIARALQLAGVARRDLQLLVVASGPGAFTGLRIGLAAVQGLAMVLGVPAIAVSALDALGAFAFTNLTGTVPLREGQSPDLVAAWMDAARGEVFAALYDPSSTAPRALALPIVGSPDDVLAAMPSDAEVLFVGDGAARYRSQILRGARHQVISAPLALAPFLAQLGIAGARRGEAGPPHALQPLYVRRPDAELERQRREVG
jgi:tRNA threonylcarbamoyladenosine biosynthesis protein TsaB